ncbi:WD40 repeat domain-containing protein [Paenibacillus sp. GCM10012307]|uniref:WD40 repeat domain-containing protein n=1 Tax=Paenibacillus roseus TaxID=2798579 RepID=A0A934J441_9BACL|nr:WD40 repeat domain-containing protein [Paenibacillus roseus]MBJ6360065.1 WD40 repeat domain-containing protein [Paenibacillus roseus]
MAHTGPIKTVVIDRKGEYVYTAGYDKRVLRWNYEKGSSEQLTQHNHLVNAVKLTQDNRYLISASADYTIRVLDLHKDEIVTELFGHNDDVESLTLANNDQLLISTSNQHDGRVLVWELSTGRILVQFSKHKNSVKSVWVNGDQVYTSDNDGLLYIWELKTGEVLQILGPFNYDLDVVTGVASKQQAFLGLDSGELVVLDTLTHKEVKRVQAHDIGIKTIKVSPSERFILTAGYDHKIKVWDVDLTYIKTLPSYPYQWEVDFAWHPDEQHILGGSFGVKYSVWDVSNETILEQDIVKATPSINDLDVRGEIIITASDDGVFRVNGEAVGQTSGILNNAAGLSSRADLAAWGDHAGAVHIYDLAAGKLRTTVQLDTGPINKIKYDEPSHSFFVGTYGGFIHQIELNEGKEIFRFKAHEGAIKGIVIEEDWILSGSTGGQSFVFNRLNLDAPPVDLKSSPFIVNDVAFSPELQLAATVGRDRYVRVFEPKSGKLKTFHNLHNYSIKSVSFNNNGVLFAGDYWGYISIWNLGTNELFKIRPASNGISSIASRGSSVLAASYDGAVYEIDEQGLFKEAIRLLQQ